jgi:hypothetical protein
MTWKINYRRHPWIHREDAERAIHAWLDQSRKWRKQRIPDEVIVQDLWIASFINDHGWITADKNFCERLARALVNGKSQTWDPIDILLLKNWRELHLNPKIQAKIEARWGKLPGLQDWSPKAIAGLLSLAGILDSDYEGDFESWFTTRRKRLGLPGKRRYEIKDSMVINDTLRVVR